MLRNVHGEASQAGPLESIPFVGLPVGYHVLKKEPLGLLVLSREYGNTIAMEPLYNIFWYTLP